MSGKMKQFLVDSTFKSMESTNTSATCGLDALRWSFDISAIVSSMESLEAFPADQLSSKQFGGSVLLLRADPTKSFYVSDATLPFLHEFFPNAQVASVIATHGYSQETPGLQDKGRYTEGCRIRKVGHWIHSDAPHEVAALYASFLRNAILLKS